MKKVIIFIIIILVAVIGLWMSKKKTDNMEFIKDEGAAKTENIDETSNSAIETDLNSINIDGTDSQFDDIEKDLQSL